LVFLITTRHIKQQDNKQQIACNNNIPFHLDTRVHETTLLQGNGHGYFGNLGKCQTVIIKDNIKMLPKWNVFLLKFALKDTSCFCVQLILYETKE
jgi:hypothetical protein